MPVGHTEPGSTASEPLPSALPASSCSCERGSRLSSAVGRGLTSPWPLPSCCLAPRLPLQAVSALFPEGKAGIGGRSPQRCPALPGPSGHSVSYLGSAAVLFQVYRQTWLRGASQCSLPASCPLTPVHKTLMMGRLLGRSVQKALSHIWARSHCLCLCRRLP